MRYSLLVFLVFANCISLMAQSLINGHRTSPFTYVYKITNDEAEVIYNASINVVNDSYFHSRIDSIATDSIDNLDLKVGHYLLSAAIENKHSITLTSVNNLEIRLVNNDQDFQVILFNEFGESITNAKVVVDKRKVYYDSERNSYYKHKTNLRGLMKVAYEGHTTFFPIRRTYNNTLVARAYRKIKYKSPVKYLWKPFRDIYRSIRWGYPEGFIQDIVNRFEPNDTEDKYGGYMAFNKPKYKPGDTVKFKAYIIKKNLSRFNKPLTIRIGNYRKKPIVLGKVEPLRKGVYVYEFVLHDSLDLDLDRYQLIWLDKKKYHTVMSKSFDYEDYELSTTHFTLTSNLQSHFKSESLELMMEATDENDLNLPDARIELTVLSESIRSFENDQVFVSDTLFKHNMKLDPLGQTMFNLPDSIFPNASIDYQVDAKFLTSNNEWTVKHLDLFYKHKISEFKMELINDSIAFKFIKNGKSISGKANLMLLASQDEILTKSIDLPYKERIYPSAAAYILHNNEQSATFHISPEDDGINVSGLRTIDSVYISLNNQRALPFWYTIFAGKKEIDRGILDGQSKEISFSVTTNKPYYVSYQYLWAGQIEEKEFEAPFYNKNLRIISTEPGVVSPGQVSKIDILVKDQKNDPVPNVDLTAYAYKKSMKGSAPEIPYLGKVYGKSIRFNRFNKSYQERLTTSEYLNYKEKSKAFGLDSISFYQFLYPDKKLFSTTIPTDDGTTQFAPFVLDSLGNLNKIHIIYVDNYPVYYSKANNTNYSFHITPNEKHSVRLRLSNKEIQIKDLTFESGKKTIFSINEPEFEGSQKTKKSNNLTESEKRTLSNFFIVIEDDFKNQYAYIKQYNRVQLASKKPHRYYSSRDKILSGPWLSDSAKIVVLDEFENNFRVDPNYEYKVSADKIKLRKLDDDYFQRWMHNENQDYKNFTIQALTERDVQLLWDNYLIDSDRSKNKFFNPQATRYGRSKIKIEFSDSLRLITVLLDKIILKGLSDPNILRVYRPSDRVFEDVEPGKYSILFLLDDNSYFEFITEVIGANGTLHLNISKVKILPVDEVINTISAILKKDKNQTNFIKGDLDKDIRLIKEISNNEPSRYSSYDRKIKGQITSSEDGSSLPGVNVVIKGTTIGTVTDIDGYYTIYAPRGSVLVFSFIGVATEEVECGSRSIIDVQLSPDVKQLSEVVVTAIGVEKSKKTLGYSVMSTLQGKAAGVKISDAAFGASSNIIIKGSTSIIGNSEAIIIVDGKPFFGKQSDLDPNTIQSIETMSSEDGVALYGSRAAAGVILIKSKVPSSLGTDSDDQSLLTANQSSENSIRNNFSDYAYWEPDLVTDKEGKATFEVTYPDDITNWKTYILGMGLNKYTGQYEGSVKSLKSISAILSLPQFLIQGDTTLALGKVTNYTSETLDVNIQFGVNDSIHKSTPTLLKRSMLDSLKLTTDTQDSLKVLFSMNSKNDTYFDGEERIIEIKRKGIELSKGYFFQIKKGSSYNLTFDPLLGDVRMNIYESESEIIESEAIRLTHYIYNCNEQMASKLLGLLTIKQIQENKGHKFKLEKEIKSLIKKLEGNQNDKGQWGWWGNSSSEDWITQHVLFALLKAQELEYDIKIKTEKILSNLKWNLDDYDPEDHIQVLRTLHMLGDNMDYKSHLDRLSTKLKKLQDVISYHQLRKDLGLVVDLDSLLDKKKETYLGNYYWEDERSSVSNNSFVNTVYVANLLSGIDSLASIYHGVIGYLIEKRSLGKWKNTFESSLAIDAILKNKMVNGTKNNDYKFSINGQAIEDFEDELIFKADTTLMMKNEGENILYLSSYQSEWVENPNAFDDYFKVTTGFKQEKNAIKAGKEETLLVELDVKNEIDYVMIEVPIPAGASYGTKTLNNFNETHREYYKEKTNIYIRSLKPGKHHYEIRLMPRYKGTYTMNPAKVESMYFPAYSGNNSIGTITIN